VSEWLTFQALFALPAAMAGLGGKLAAAVLVSLLGLTGALAAACFAKVFGMVFLAKPRSAHAAEAREAPALMLAPMGLLAALCLALGVLPVLLLGTLARTVAPFLGEAAAEALAPGEWYAAGFKATAAAGTISPRRRRPCCWPGRWRRRAFTGRSAGAGGLPGRPGHAASCRPPGWINGHRVRRAYPPDVRGHPAA
jgi:hypothetical protein